MTDRHPVKLLIVLSSTRARAVEIAARNEVEPAEVLWPRSLGDLAGHEALPLYVDASLWNHPAGYDLAEHIGGLLRATWSRRTHAARLARGNS